MNLTVLASSASSTLLAAREQMAFTLAFHILLVPIGVALPTITLIANWRAEIARFAPSLSVVVAHPSEVPPAERTDAHLNVGGQRWTNSRSSYLRANSNSALS